MTLSQKAWALSDTIIHAIKEHPFNQELTEGTLAKDKFAYYLEQDTHYLQIFSKCQAMIASKIPPQYFINFLRYAEYTLITEQEVVHEFFNKLFNFEKSGLLAPATLNYTNHLLHICSNEPVEIAVAAVLPCFWVYREVGLSIAKLSNHNNPYARWIETYASDDFNATVNEAIHIFDHLAEETSPTMRKKMLDTFYKSTCLEWYFWDDAYHKAVFGLECTSPTKRLPVS